MDDFIRKDIENFPIPDVYKTKEFEERYLRQFKKYGKSLCSEIDSIGVCLGLVRFGDNACQHHAFGPSRVVIYPPGYDREINDLYYLSMQPKL